MEYRLFEIRADASSPFFRLVDLPHGTRRIPTPQLFYFMRDSGMLKLVFALRGDIGG